MKTLKDEALEYEPKVTRVVSDLEYIDTQWEVFTKEATAQNGEKFVYKYVVVGGEHYRVPFVVLDDLQTMLKENPNLRYFKVLKKGEGITTKYKTIPLEKPTSDKLKELMQITEENL